MLLLDAPVTVREVMSHEEVPLADVFREVGRFLIGREDVVLFGAQAVNVYAETERMTQDVDVMSTRASATGSIKSASRRIDTSWIFGKPMSFPRFAWSRACASLLRRSSSP